MNIESPSRVVSREHGYGMEWGRHHDRDTSAASAAGGGCAAKA